MLETWFETTDVPTVMLFAAIFLFATGVAILTVFVVVPVRRLVRQLAEFAPGSKELKGFRFRNEAQLLSQTFKLLTGELKSKEAELQRLYEQAEARASFMERYSERLVESIPVGVVALTAEGKVTTLNGAAEQLFGARLPEVVGKDASALWGDATPVDRVARLARDSGRPLGRVEVLWRGRADDAPARVLQVIATGLSGAGSPGERAHVLTFYDLTPLRELEERIRTTERLAAIGTLSAGLAHEIRNPLGAVLGYSDLLVKRTQGEERELAGTIAKEARNLDRVVTEFLEFVRKREASHEPVQWVGIVDEIRLRLSRVLDARKVRLSTGDLPSAGDCALDRASLQQVLYNVILNAVEASPSGGEVVMSVARRGEQGAAWIVTVEDTGGGIPPEIRSKVFDPFFTTKPEGMGLGLSIVHRIVTGAGGSVEVESAPGKGTVIRLTVPVG